MNCLIFTGCFQGETGLKFDSSGKITFLGLLAVIGIIVRCVKKSKNIDDAVS